MKNFIFLHDTALDTPRGAELTINQLINLGEIRNHNIKLDNLIDFDQTKNYLSNADLVIVCSITHCRYEIELIDFLISNKFPYIKIEFDYNFCVRRNILCTVEREITNCCNPNKFHRYRKLYANSLLNVFQSPNHYKAHFDFFGEAVSNHMIKPPTVNIEYLNISDTKIENVIPFFGELNYLKGGKAYVEYAIKHPEIKFEVYGKNKLRQEIPDNISFHKPVSNQKVLEILGKTRTFFCQPVWPEPSGRLAAEAFLSGCDIISNDRIGTFSFDFYPNDKEKAIHQMSTVLDDFWNRAENFTNANQCHKVKSLGKVLAYKSYGGLGDIFFAIPSIYELSKVATELHFAVSPRLVKFFSKYIDKSIKVVNEQEVKSKEDGYDNVYELGNYPAFKGYDLPHALKYPTHKKVKQHAIQHYIDTVSKLHISIDNSLKKYPYFKTNTNLQNPYFVVHPGAGFLLKIWPTDKYAQLIEKLNVIYPHLGCKIIKGSEDPSIEKYFSKPMPHIEYITGDMVEVGNAMSGALFHIGNDAGITHVAGAFNIPSVGIYGPTGPGSWGSFAQYNELIWGKKGVCNVKCNYNVIINCEHKICLNSVTVDRVLEALYKLLHKAYSKSKNKTFKVNPIVIIDKGEKDCLLTLNEKEFLLEYHDQNMEQLVNSLLEEEKIELNTISTFDTVLTFLKEENIIFEIPTFRK